ncbi:amidohydrolase family protein [Alkalicoccus luteus]|uniref:amidohydrolase family protein n=1 Tax=Alkalicoccus luteus TaxID=1237094 RepID=UPI00403498EC
MINLFDAHLHIIDPAYPLQMNNGYKPPVFTVSDYEKQRAWHNGGGAVVSGSFQGFDQTYVTNALRQLGSGYVGVTQLPSSVTAEEVAALHQQSIRALRLNLYRGGSAELNDLERLADLVYETAGWHVELYADARTLADIRPSITRPERISIDHLGLHPEGLPALLDLVSNGAAVKATGFGRYQGNPIEAMVQINEENPEALMFGTDLPSTRAPVPFSDKDIERVQHAFSNSERIFHHNARRWYRLTD